VSQGPEPLTNLLRVLCGEPLCYRVDEVANLTPFQVRRILLVERDKEGKPMLDLPMDTQPDETTLEQEFVEEFRRRGINDPDLLKRLAREAAEREEADDRATTESDE